MTTQRTQAKAEARRAATMELVLGGATYRRIVSALRKAGFKTSLGTVAADVRRLNQRYREESLESIEEAMTVDLRRLDALLLAVWERALAGDREAMSQALRIIASRSELLSYPEVQFREHGEHAEASDLSREEEAVLLAVLASLRSGRSLPPLQLDAATGLPALPTAAHEDIPPPPHPPATDDGVIDVESSAGDPPPA